MLRFFWNPDFNKPIIKKKKGNFETVYKNSYCCLATKLCPNRCNSMDCSLPGSSVQEIFQARIPEWIAISSSRGTSPPRDQTHVSCISCTGVDSLPLCHLVSPVILLYFHKFNTWFLIKKFFFVHLVGEGISHFKFYFPWLQSSWHAFNILGPFRSYFEPPAWYPAWYL